MTIWTPRLRNAPGPIYARIADQLERDVADGLLHPGSRLPTQRELARRLGLTVVTVTRAYAEAAQRGLVDATVGRGTFVKDAASAQRRPGDAEIDLATNVLLGGLELGFTPELIERLTASLADSYRIGPGSERHRAAGAEWIRRARPDADAGRIVVTAGGQQAMLLALAATTKPGDAVLAEHVAYHGIRAVAAMLHLKLEPLPMDRFGVTPDAFDRVARRSGAKVAWLTPTLQNPTGATMSERRRRDIAAIAARRGITIVEDDVYGFLADAPPAVTSHLPDSGIFLTGLGKSITPALRVGYLLAPAALLPRIHAALSATSLFTSPLGAEIAATWIEDGTAARAAAEKRRLIVARHHLARRILGKRIADTPSSHLWIELPERRRADDVAAAARQRGVRIATAADFAVGEGVPNAIRLCIGSPATIGDLDAALRVVDSILGSRAAVAAAPPPVV
jgi:DNA-binding transcriptional MocR family regulator